MAQLVNVQAGYNRVGDCIFSARKNEKVPMYVQINLAGLENSLFNESPPNVKCYLRDVIIYSPFSVILMKTSHGLIMMKCATVFLAKTGVLVYACRNRLVENSW